MTKNGKAQDATELEAELLMLNVLVRERRKQLARLQKCPNKDCPCRLVWRDHVERNLADQVREIRRQVLGSLRKSTRSKTCPQPRRRSK